MTIISQLPDTTAGILVADLDRRLTNLMSDEDRVRWTLEERIDWFNDAAREIVERRPAARAITMTFTLAAGTFQAIPDGCTQLLDVVRNVKADGSASTPIRIADRQDIDASDPTWHTRRAGPTKNYVIDERSPTTFHVWPPAVADARVQALVAMPPPAVTQLNDTLKLRPEFIGPIINWALYRCHTKDSEYAQGAVAAQHYQAFMASIGEPAAAAQTNSATGNSA